MLPENLPSIEAVTFTDAFFMRQIDEDEASDEANDAPNDAPICAEDDALWCQWIELLGRIACGLPSRGSPLVDRLLGERDLLARCFDWRRRRSAAVRESVDELLTWFLDRRLAVAQSGRFLAGSSPLLALRGLVRLIPPDPADWGRWLASGPSAADGQRPLAPFGAKCACIVLLYYVESRQVRPGASPAANSRAHPARDKPRRPARPSRLD